MFNFKENEKVANLDGVPADFRPLYKENAKGGGFTLSQEGEAGSAVKAILGLNVALAAARREADEHKGNVVDISTLSEFGDSPETILSGFTTQLDELRGQVKGGEKAKIDVEKIKADFAAQAVRDTAVKDKRIDGLTGQLYGLLVESRASEAMLKHGVASPELLLPFIKQGCRVVEEDDRFNVFVVDGDGSRRYSTVTGSPMNIDELVSEMKGNERYGPLFASEAPDGSGSTPGAPGRPAPQKRARENMTPNEKIEYGLSKGQAIGKK